MKAHIAFAALVVALGSATAGAQCLVPDGLNGPCCAPASAVLPAFPAYQMPGLGICFQQCAPAATPCVLLDFGAPNLGPCGQYKADLKVIDCAFGNTQVFGSVLLDYTRTWQETSPGGPIQVWRFAAKVDMSRNTSIAANPCLVPSSLNTFPTVFYYGYVDYAYDCTANTWEMAAALVHQCDWFIHGSPIVSSTPGAHHPARSYALVGPNTPGNPFVPALSVAPFGGLVGDGTRTVDPSTPLCSTRESIQGGISPLAQACACAPSAQPPQLTARRLNTQGGCGTTVTSLDLTTSGLPWLHLMTTSIGTWSTPANYPGPERLWLDEGPVLYTEGCPSTAGVISTFADVMYGATTRGGYPAFPVLGVPPVDTMTDLASNYSWDLSTPLPLPMFGNVMPTRHLVSLSLP
ncbi:MAG: hypothetical protein GC161_13925 [Planctomycetaceae bacterium]|nr:hypothetical protein [Planctomycetaceae bacterium]